MSSKQVMIFVDESEKEKRHNAEASVSRILATYPGSILAEVTETQVEKLTKEGFQLESLTGGETIKLRSIEFDPTVEAPAAPAALSLRTAEVGPTEENYWIVQFIGPVKSEWGEAVRELGGNIGDYVPDNAFLVRMTPKVKDQVSELDFVRWVGPYQPAYKISPLMMGIRGKASPATLRNAKIKVEEHKPTPTGNMRVVVHKAHDTAAVRQEVEHLGGTVISAEKEVLRISLDASHIEELARIPSVQWIEPYILPKLFNDVAASIIGVQPVWNNHGLDGEGQIIAIADTGLDTGFDDVTMHDDFKGRIVSIHSWPVPAGLRPYLDNKSWDDGAADLDSGHGSHVAGSVLGSGARSNGGIRGMAFNAQLVFQAVEQYLNVKPAYQGQMSDGYYLVGIPDDLNFLFQKSYDDGARIFSNSWGGVTDNSGNPAYSQYTSDSQAIDEFVWTHKDAVILFAAGNEGKDVENPRGFIDPDSLCVQATAKNIITVGACESNRAIGGINPDPNGPARKCTYGECWPQDFSKDPIKSDRLSNNPDGMSAFSSRGPADDGRIKPDIVAPGTNILSVRSSKASETGWGLLPVGDARRDFYMFMGGTSMATPITAGAVALIRQYLQNNGLSNPSAALIKAILIHGAVPMKGQYTIPEVGAVPNSDEGWGRINIENSLFPASPSKLEFRASAADAVETGDQRNYIFEIIDSSVPFRATLVWTDFPSKPLAEGLVNKLRLSVVAPDGTVIPGAPENNNIQQVVLDAPQTGTYTVRVTGHNIPTMSMLDVNQKQDFALAVTGGL